MSRKFELVNPYHQVLKQFNILKVEYLVIGVSAINYHAPSSLHIISTMDYDVFIRLTVENVMRCLKSLENSDFSCCYKLKSGSLRPIKMISKGLASRIFREGSIIVAEGPYKTIVEILFDVSGFAFEDMVKRAVYMKDKNLNFSFPVACLDDLIESKRIAGREKDIQFLAKYKTLFK
ncbi:MAG: hypothetical protein HYT97_08050 [Elusimicrobia bacterium]|nr:hypothetical protein [Elusimicrobiota bacterium]